MPRVVFFTDLHAELAAEVIATAPPGWDVDVLRHDLPESDKLSSAADADFLILFPSVIEESVLRAAGKLRLVQLVSAGFDSMPMQVLAELGVPVANNGGTNSIDVAEHALALMLGVYRLIPQMDRNVRAGGWRDIDSGQETFTIHGKTVGIVGLGHIGQQVAQRLAPFGATLIYSDAVAAPAEVERQLRVQHVALDDLLRRADIVSLHVPLNDGTHHLIGARELALMKPTAILINTCRGPVVDPAALSDALSSRQIRAAGLDVLATEPADRDDPLLELDNVLLSPHIAGVTHDTWRRRGRFIFENLQRVWDGQPAHALVSSSDAGARG